MAFSGKGKKIIASIKKQSILKKFCVFIIVAVIATSLISGIIMYHYTTKYMTESKSEDIKKAVDDVSILFSQMYTTYINNIDELGNWVSEDGQNEFEIMSICSIAWSCIITCSACTVLLRKATVLFFCLIRFCLI